LAALTHLTGAACQGWWRLERGGIPREGTRKRLSAVMSLKKKRKKKMKRRRRRR
jgi:hypothetical protein